MYKGRKDHVIFPAIFTYSRIPRHYVGFMEILMNVINTAKDNALCQGGTVFKEIGIISIFLA